MEYAGLLQYVTLLALFIIFTWAATSDPASIHGKEYSKPSKPADCESAIFKVLLLQP